MLVVQERGLRTNPKTKVDAIMWWIDSGATTHVCKDRCWFKTYEPVEDGSVLYMGDDHFAHVHGKGSVSLEFSFGKTITLFNVLYVPKLRKNLVFGPMLNKCGYKHVYESDKYILSNSGVFVGFGYYNNSMFMLNLNKVPGDSDSAYMSSFTVVNSSLWHARLGHVHYKRMLKMPKDDLIPAIDENPEKYKGGEYYDLVFSQSVGIIHETIAPYTPQQNGVAKRKNRALKEMVNSMLSYSGLSEEFWGEAMLTACYLLNRVPNKRNKTTPYELWKTLGEKGIDCIFVGYAEHSKAYRPKDNIPNVQESQMDDHTDDVPNEIFEPRKVLRKILEPIIKLCNLGMLLSRKKQLMMRLVANGSSKGKVDGTIDKFKARLLIHDLVIHQMDVNTIFLNGDLDEEVYMKQPEGFVMPSNEHKKFNREDCSSVSTLMDPVEKLMPNTGKPVDQLEYSRAIGCLMYAMTSTRPDIAYVVGRLSRFTSNLSRQHWKAITKVFKYLRGTKDYGLSYVGYLLVLEGYSVASWINHVEDSASTSRWVFLLGGGAISWASNKQICITSSTMEYEFVALAVADRGGEYYDPVFFQSVGIIHETTAPYTPQQNGVAKRKNRALKEMVNSMLSYSGLSEDCGAVVKLPDPKRKTLGEKGIDCIFVGYAEHIKAYRPKDIIPNVQESQMDDHTDDVPNAIFEPRKGKRVRKAKSYGSDFQLYLVMGSRDQKEAIDDEISSIMENNTWVLSDLPPGCKPLAIHDLVIHQMDVNTTFLNGELDEEVYMKQPEGFVMPVDKTKKFLSSRFSMKDMEEAGVILGIKIKRENKGLSLHNLSILRKYSRSLIVKIVLWFTSNPSRQHWKAITKVFKYLRGTKDYGLSYVGYPLVLEGYLVASWINHVEDSTSTSRWVFLLGGGAISWASKKQICITSSTMESEFVALAVAGKEAEWLRNLIHDISIWPKPIAPISIQHDSAPTMARAYS
nr:zinc finger, CCHC-type [Tanacetum cinerariifolium]